MDSPTSYQINQLLLISASGRAIDISGIWKEISIYEDLFSNTMSGSILLNDSRNLINEVPIIGSEYLMISFEKSNQDITFKKTFRVYKLSDRIYETGTNETYFLHFASEECLLNEQLRISKAYQSRTISTMAEDLCLKELMIPANRCNIESTDYPVSLIIPAWKPFRALNWFSELAISNAVLSASWIFFENRLGYHFKSIETMLRAESVLDINVGPRNLGKNRSRDDSKKQLEHVMQFEHPHGCDELQTISMGAYASRLTVLDLDTQSQRDVTLSVDQQFPTTMRGNTYPPFQRLLNRFDKSPQEMSDSFYRIMPTGSEIHRNLLQRRMYLAALHNHRVNMVLPGNLALMVGSPVNVHYPAAVLNGDAEKILDQTYSGKYLITSIQHKIDRQKYVCLCELMKESRATILPVADKQVQKLGKE